MNFQIRSSCEIRENKLPTLALTSEEGRIWKKVYIKESRARGNVDTDLFRDNPPVPTNQKVKVGRGRDY